MPGPGRKAQQLNWALRPEALREILGEDLDPARVFVGVSDADSIPDPDTLPLDRRARSSAGAGALAYQGITLSLANYDRLAIRGKICAIQQSSIFIRVSIARLINEVKRVRLFDALAARFPRLGRRSLRPVFELLLPPLADLPRPQPVRAPRHAAVGGRLSHLRRHRGLDARLCAGRARHPDPGAADGRADRPARDVREDDPPERALVPGRARRHPVPVARRGAQQPTAFNLAQLVRHVGNKVVEWPIAALVYPADGLPRLVSRLHVPRAAPDPVLRRHRRRPRCRCS